MALDHMKNFGRIAACGSISVYNDTTPQTGACFPISVFSNGSALVFCFNLIPVCKNNTKIPFQVRIRQVNVIITRGCYCVTEKLEKMCKQTFILAEFVFPGENCEDQHDHKLQGEMTFIRTSVTLQSRKYSHIQVITVFLRGASWDQKGSHHQLNLRQFPLKASSVSAALAHIITGTDVWFKGPHRYIFLFLTTSRDCPYLTQMC